MKKKLLITGLLLSTLALSNIAAVETQAANTTVDTEQVQEDPIGIEHGIVYRDASGEHIIEASNPTIKLNATNSEIKMTVDGKKISLKGVTDVTFKGITVDSLIPFYVDSVVNLTLDQVNFKKGVDFSIMNNIESLTVKDSQFGSTDYSLAIHSSHKLTDVTIDNSTFNADLRIYSNHALEGATIQNSVFKKDVSQYSNKKGYKTTYLNNRMEREKVQRVLRSGGMNANDTFTINPTESAIGESNYRTDKDGFVKFVDASGNAQKVAVPMGVNVKELSDYQDRLTIKLTNGEEYQFTGTKELVLYNVKVDQGIAFTNKRLRLERMAIINSVTKLVDVAYSETINYFEVVKSSISQSSGYLSVYNNPGLRNVVLQDSSVEGSSGYISVYNNKQLESFAMNGMYTYGYLSAYNLNGTDLQIGNSHFDDYISTNSNIDGVADYVPVGEVPVFEGLEDKATLKNGTIDFKTGVTAIDDEDGDLTENITVDDSDVIYYLPGTYSAVYSVTDSDGNLTEATISVTVF